MSKTDNNRAAAPCPLCDGTLCLSQYGIFKIFLMPAKLSLLLIFAGIAGMAFFSKYMLLVVLAGVIIPLANADFRLFMYPVAIVASLLGRSLNCPRCNPHGNVFLMLEKVCKNIRILPSYPVTLWSGHCLIWPDTPAAAT